MKNYTAVYERDDSGWWLVRIKELRGCHTQGRTITQARLRVREALSLYIHNAEKVILRDQIKLPARARSALQEVQSTRRHADQVLSKLHTSTATAIKLLIHGVGISVRDAGELLNLSHQRVHQILTGK